MRDPEGIAAAKANGVQFGHPPLKRPAEFEEICSKWPEGKLSSRTAARKLNISQQTFLNWSREFA